MFKCKCGCSMFIMCGEVRCNHLFWDVLENYAKCVDCGRIYDARGDEV